jgi:NHLM bacteriocin system ABC transporter ATP-binding protein
VEPGRSLRSTTLPQALQLLERVLAIRFDAKPHTPVGVDAGDAVEETAATAGLRARRVILDGRWWESAGLPMLARVAERRGTPRPGDADSTSTPAGTGWVALIPNPVKGYRMRVADGQEELESDVDERTAARLAPFAYTFHRCFERRALSAADVLRFAWVHNRADASTVVATGLAAALIGLLTPIATGFLIDRAIPAATTSLVAQVIAGLVAAGLALIGLEMVRTLALLRFESRTGVAVQAAILDRVISAPAAFFRAFASGDLAMRMSAANTVQRALAGTAIGTIVVGIFLLANFALLFKYSASLAAASMGLILVAIAIPAAAGLARLKLGRRIEALDGRLNGLSVEYLAGIAKLRAAAAEGRAFANYFRSYEELRALNRRSTKWMNLESVAMSLLQPAAAILVFWLAWQQAAGARIGRLSTGDFIAFQAALFALLGGVQVLVATWMSVLRLKPLWERAKPILESIPETGDAARERHDPQGRITLDGVAFAYPGGPEVLKGIDLEIAPGEFVALVGASGSGKSTLLRLLLGFETPTRGTVRFDGKDLATLELRRLRRGIGTVLQSGRLWAGDLFTNIAGAANLDIEDAWEAARLAGIAADIEAMPMGMYTLVGEGLSTVSGGQRQRVLLARALAVKPKLLLLDEATSALDNLAQATVLESLGGLAATRIVIAHRLNTVRNADRIVVLDAGRIVQMGTYDQLAGAPGPFRALLAGQGA